MNGSIECGTMTIPSSSTAHLFEKSQEYPCQSLGSIRESNMSLLSNESQFPKLGSGAPRHQETLEPGSLIRGRFKDEIFKARYQRNNKRRGLKNLRCFPSCGFRHKERGFCGRSVEIELENPCPSPGMALYCWAEFVLEGDAPRIVVGEVVPMKKILSLERSKNEPTKPLVRGEQLFEKYTGTNSVFEFNKERRGWHYGWASNKHTCDAQHSLKCYVFEGLENRAVDLICRATFKSPTFMLFCRRRRRFILTPSAPVSMPISRKRSSSMNKKGIFGEAITPDTEIENCSHKNNLNGSGLKRAKIIKKETAAFSHPDIDSMSGDILPKVKEEFHNELEFGLSLTEDELVCRSVGLIDDLEANKTKLLPKRRGASRVNSLKTDRIEIVMSRLSIILRLIESQRQQERAEKSTNPPPHLDYHDDNPAVLPDEANIEEDNAFLSQFDWSMALQAMENDDGFSENGTVDIRENLSVSSIRPLSSLDDDFVLSCNDEDIDDWKGSFFPSCNETSTLEMNRSTCLSMLKDLASYMRKESSFARAVDALIKQTRNGTPDYLGFVDLVEDHLDSFRRKQNISRFEFNRMLNQACSSVKNSFDNRNNELSNMLDLSIENKSENSRGIISSAIGALASFVGGGSEPSKPSKLNYNYANQPKFLDGPVFCAKIPNIQGSWRQTEASEHAMQQMRLKVGTPWILSKMFEFMESSYEIELKCDTGELIMRLQGTWIKNTELGFILDGEARHWGIVIPAPFSQLSRGWSYRAWVENDRIVLVHMIGDQQLTRFVCLSRNRSTLHSTVILGIQDARSGWREMGRVQQEASRYP